VKIDDSMKKAAGLPIGTTQTRSTGATGNAKGTEKAGATNSAGAASENVSLSAQAKALSGSGGVFDAAKVEEIKAAISNGTFRVDPEKVASGLLDTVTDLLRTTRKA
jgi:negative regulator of flagellin synthesis FlgM